MPQSLARVLVHLVFSTKDRLGLIHDRCREELHAYLGGTLKGLDCVPMQVGGSSDHVHCLFALGRTVTIADVVRQLKTAGAGWCHEKGMRDFAWQAGYGVFSVSESKAPEVTAYIVDQASHHHRLTFQEEYRAFLVRHRIVFDEHYVWD